MNGVIKNIVGNVLTVTCHDSGADLPFTIDATAVLVNNEPVTLDKLIIGEKVSVTLDTETKNVREVKVSREVETPKKVEEPKKVETPPVKPKV